MNKRDLIIVTIMDCSDVQYFDPATKRTGFGMQLNEHYTMKYDSEENELSLVTYNGDSENIVISNIGILMAEAFYHFFNNTFELEKEMGEQVERFIDSRVNL